LVGKHEISPMLGCFSNACLVVTPSVQRGSSPITLLGDEPKEETIRVSSRAFSSLVHGVATQ
jgi:hypothetical protein